MEHEDEAVDYGEAYNAFHEFVEKDEFEEVRDELAGTGDARPRMDTLGDRAIFYLQISDELSGEYRRVALAEYRDGEENPVPFEADELEGVLDGRGEVEIDERLVEQRDINYPEQRHRV